MAALLLFVVSGMPPDHAQAQEQDTKSAAPTFVRVSVGECPFTVDFRGPPFTHSTIEDETPTKYAVYENARVRETFACGCDEALNAENMTRSDADAIADDFVRRKGGDLVTITSEFLPAGELGREVKYEGRFPKSIRGPIRIFARMIFVGKCVAGFISSMYESDDQQEAVRFLASVARVEEGSATATKETSGPSSGTDTSRLLKFIACFGVS
jgi:hypothetical protein